MKIVLTTGCFDKLHPGHLMHLMIARSLGDMLVVAVAADEVMERAKGRKPAFNINERLSLLRSLRCVDLAICNDEHTPDQIIRWVRPALYAKGDEYKDALPEQALVESLGGKVVFTGPKLHDSSAL